MKEPGGGNAYPMRASKIVGYHREDPLPFRPHHIGGTMCQDFGNDGLMGLRDLSVLWGCSSIAGILLTEGRKITVLL